MKFDCLIVGTLRGKPAWSNGHFMCVGKPPREMFPAKELKDPRRTANFDQVLRRVAKNPTPAKPRIIAVGGKRAFMELGRNCIVAKRYFHFIKKQFPKAEFFVGSSLVPSGERVMLAILKKKVVAVVMPVRVN